MCNIVYCSALGVFFCKIEVINTYILVDREFFITVNLSYSLQVLLFVFVCLVLLHFPGLVLCRLFVDRDGEDLLVVLDSLVAFVLSLPLQEHCFLLPLVALDVLLVVLDVRVPVMDRVCVSSPNVFVFLLFADFCVILWGVVWCGSAGVVSSPGIMSPLVKEPGVDLHGSVFLVLVREPGVLVIFFDRLESSSSSSHTQRKHWHELWSNHAGGWHLTNPRK